MESWDSRRPASPRMAARVGSSNSTALNQSPHSFKSWKGHLTTEQIYAKLTDIFRDVFDDETLVLTPELTASDVPGWDSFNHINLIVATEVQFKIKFKTAELESLRNV